MASVTTKLLSYFNQRSYFPSRSNVNALSLRISKIAYAINFELSARTPLQILPKKNKEDLKPAENISGLILNPEKWAYMRALVSFAEEAEDLMDWKWNPDIYSSFSIAKDTIQVNVEVLSYMQTLNSLKNRYAELDQTPELDPAWAELKANYMKLELFFDAIIQKKRELTADMKIVRFLKQYQIGYEYPLGETTASLQRILDLKAVLKNIRNKDWVPLRRHLAALKQSFEENLQKDAEDALHAIYAYGRERPTYAVATHSSYLNTCTAQLKALF